MDELVQILEQSTAREIYMIAGWNQWADAGAISSGLPQYLIEKTGARKIAEIAPDPFYLFQLPGTHHFLRPEVKLENGYPVGMSRPTNEFHYAGDGSRGLVIFLGEEPQMNAGRYAGAFFQIAKALDVRQVAAVGGVYGAMPYDRDRQVSCIYSTPAMKEKLEEYAVRFSNYEGGATIGAYMTDRAEGAGVEFLVLNAFVPAYDFVDPETHLEGIRIENDFRAWHELMRRFNHMFGLGIDLSDLGAQSEELTHAVDDQIDELARKLPHLNVREELATAGAEFEETSFMPLDDIWKEELDDLFRDLDD